MAKVLLIERDEKIAKLEKDYIVREGYKVIIENSHMAGVGVAMQQNISLCIIGDVSSASDCIEICKEIRNVKDIPIIFVSSETSEDYKITAFEAGADDYVVKPFSPSEVAARVKANINMYDRLVYGKESIKDVIETSGIVIDKKTRTVTVDGEKVILTAKEFDLLVLLVTNPNIVFKKDEIFRRVWGMESVGDVATITVHIQKLRDKMHFNGKKTGCIETIWGVGYRFKP